MTTKIRLGHGERLIMIGHDIAIVCLTDGYQDENGDTIGVESVAYTAEDWRALCSASFIFSEDECGPGLFRVNSCGDATGYAVKYREPRCASERKRFERLAVKAGIRAEGGL